MSAKYILLKNVRLLDALEPVDVLIDGKTIGCVGAGISAEDAELVDCNGNLLLGSFVDCHTHLDKAFMETPRSATCLMDAVMLTMDYQKSIPNVQIRADVQRRGRKMLDLEIQHGSGIVRSHVSVDDIWGMEAFYASCELRSLYADKLELQLSVPYMEAYAGAWAEAARAGEIDYIAGYPTISRNPRASVDQLFALAEQFGLPLDLHVDESDAPNIDCFEYVLKKTIESGMQGKVNCSHVTALAAVTQKKADAAISLCRCADVSIISLPSCNMFLMGREDRGLVRRGITRIRDLLDAGVNVAIASDNIRDPFRPFGNADMLEEALFTCQVLSDGSDTGMRQVLHMVTDSAACASGKNKNRNSNNFSDSVTPGGFANLVLLNKSCLKQAIIEGAVPRLVIKNGGIVFEKEGVDK
ncbi:MAG: amidohydrolase family protein [Clostridia bacterium]